ncbi:MAG: NAD(P)/FAD-dependent oxidoreductase, partial [Thermoleophilum sp.]|nr:NAD(P)/FAD-dependent oxidoreductase [Thermoleophilum sp.]
MANLTRASEQLFRRRPDERFETLGDVLRACREDAERSTDRWRPPKGLRPVVHGRQLKLDLGDGDEPFALNDWSFTQLCGLSKVSKDTAIRLSAETAGRVIEECLPAGNRPAQLFTRDSTIRSIHGHSYSRLHDSDVVSMLMEFAVDFTPPQVGCNGATGLYRGEQDLFCFLIDPTGWVEIEGEAFAPGFFAWIMPSGSGRGRLGLAVDPRATRRPPLYYLERLAADHPVASRRVAGARVVRKLAGRIPILGLRRPTWTEGMLVIGDAAGQVKATSGGGIYFAMLAGELAADAAGRYLGGGPGALRAYEAAWQ